MVYAMHDRDHEMELTDNVGYHVRRSQGWLSNDGKTYVFADETNGKKIKKCELKEKQDCDR